MSHGTVIPHPITPLNYDSTDTLHVLETDLDPTHLLRMFFLC